MATQDHWIPIHGNPNELAAASPPKAEPPPIYQFGDFSLDVGRAELWRSGGRVDIQPLVLDLLTYLIANRGRVASKEELFLNVWGGDVSVVDTALTTAVCEARKALDDDHVQQWAIRTMPRRGYRFIAPTAEGARV